MPQRIRCAHCSGVIQVADAAIGKKIRCPKCQEVITATPAAAPAPISAQPPKRSPAKIDTDRAPRRRREDDDDDERPRKRSKTSRSSSLVLPLSIAGAALAVLVALGVAVVLLLPDRGGRGMNPAEAVAEGRGVDEEVHGAKPHGLAVEKIDSDFTIPPTSDETWLKKRSERLEGARQTLRLAYDKVGKRNAAWDEPVREAMELAAEMFSGPSYGKVTHTQIHPLTKKALEAGCDDPLLLYLYARTSTVANYPGAPEYQKRLVHAAEAMRTSAYSPYRRAVALQVAAHAMWSKDISAEDRKRGLEYVNQALALLSESVATETNNADFMHHWFETANDIRTAYISYAMAGGPLASLEFVEKGLGKSPQAKAIAHRLRGEFMLSWAWEARGSGAASRVTDDAWRKFDERLHLSEDNLREASNLIPSDAWAATRLITVVKGLDGHRDIIKQWFDRAMQADPDQYDACLALLDYLDPKWHGSDREMLAFARLCRDSKNSYSRVPLLVAEAHFRVTSRFPEDLRQQYFRAPAIWKEISGVYDRFFTRWPDHRGEHCRYAVFCYLCGMYDKSKLHFEQSQDVIDESMSISRFYIQQVRREVIRPPLVPKKAMP
jgi:phage FluMu protein Com